MSIGISFVIKFLYWLGLQQRVM